MSNKVIDELQILTGIVSDDLDYLVYKLMENGSFFKEDTEQVENVEQETLYDWFMKLERVK